MPQHFTIISLVWVCQRTTQETSGKPLISGTFLAFYHNTLFKLPERLAERKHEGNRPRRSWISPPKFDFRCRCSVPILFLLSKFDTAVSQCDIDFATSKFHNAALKFDNTALAFHATFKTKIVSIQ